MVIPKITIKIQRNKSPRLSCNNLKSGINFSMSITEPKTATIAIAEAISPFIIARLFSGLEINPLVAPTICIVLIKNRLLYIASLMVLSIDITTSTVNKIAAIIKITAAVFTNLLTCVKVSVGN